MITRRVSRHFLMQLMCKFEETLENGISKIQSHYLGECLEVDELTVYILKHVQENYHLRCHIYKDKECIFQTIISGRFNHGSMDITVVQKVVLHFQK